MGLLEITTFSVAASARTDQTFVTVIDMMRVRYGAAFLIGPPWVKRHTVSCRQCSLLLPASFSTTAAAAVASPSVRIITYLTDVEGDAAYLDRYVNQSKVLHFTKSAPTKTFPYDECVDFSADNAVLVYGGDIWDRGGSDLYVIRQLLDLQKRHSGRVHFIMGNRDLNKMRILSELGVEGADLPQHKGVYWLRGTGRQGDPLLDDNQVSQTSAAERLKWILAQTMGSPEAFELRKKELQRETQDGQVTDDDVVASYRRSCHPTGEMGQYLQQAHLALRLGDILFMHGSLPLTQPIVKRACEEETVPKDFWKDFEFAMPWKKSESADPVPHSVDEWLAALETFVREHVAGWKSHVAHLEMDSGQTQHDVWSTKGGYDYSTSEKHYEMLLQYGMGWTPDGNRNPTVVYSSWLNNGFPSRFLPDASKPEDAMFAALVREFFISAGLQLILSGHQPHGDMPTRIQIGEAQNIICCDTSYSGDTIWWNEPGSKSRTNVGRGSGSSGRGNVAVSEVLIEQVTKTGDVMKVECHGTLSDGSTYDICHFPTNDDTVGQLARDELVPNKTPRERLWWVKAKFYEGSFLISSGEGFNVWNCVVEPKTQ